MHWSARVSQHDCDLLSDWILRSIVISEAANREISAQVVIKRSTRPLTPEGAGSVNPRSGWSKTNVKTPQHYQPVKQNTSQPGQDDSHPVLTVSSRYVHLQTCSQDRWGLPGYMAQYIPEREVPDKLLIVSLSFLARLYGGISAWWIPVPGRIRERMGPAYASASLNRSAIVSCIGFHNPRPFPRPGSDTLCRSCARFPSYWQYWRSQRYAGPVRYGVKRYSIRLFPGHHTGNGFPVDPWRCVLPEICYHYTSDMVFPSFRRPARRRASPAAISISLWTFT